MKRKMCRNGVRAKNLKTLVPTKPDLESSILGVNKHLRISRNSVDCGILIPNANSLHKITIRRRCCRSTESFRTRISNRRRILISPELDIINTSKEKQRCDYIDL